jgi:hypothetical protein
VAARGQLADAGTGRQLVDVAGLVRQQQHVAGAEQAGDGGREGGRRRLDLCGQRRRVTESRQVHRDDVEMLGERWNDRIPDPARHPQRMQQDQGSAGTGTGVGELWHVGWTDRCRRT